MIAIIILLNALSAVGFPTTKFLLDHIQPFFLSGIRLMACGILLFGYNFITTGSFVKYKKSDLWIFFKLSFLSFFISFGVGLWALQYVTAAKSSFLYNLVPFLSALFSYFYFSEKMTFKKWIGLGIGFIGFLPILMANGQGQNNAALISFADMILLLAVVTYTYGLIVTRQIMRSGDYTPITINATAMFVGGVLSVLFAPFIDSRPFVQTITVVDSIVFALAVVSVAISYSLTAYLLKKYTATFLSFAAFIMPFFAAFYSWIFLGEHISWQFFVSTVAVLIGLYIFYKEELKQGYIVR